MHEMSTGISGMAGGLNTGAGNITASQANSGMYTDFWTPEQWAYFGSKGGQVGTNGTGYGLSVDPTKAYTVDASVPVADQYSTSLSADQIKGMDTDMAALSGSPVSLEAKATDTDWGSMKGAGGVALGAANFGLGLAGFLDQKKTAKLQRGLMQQQLASNEETMANKREDRAHLKNVFGGGTATSGLKAV